jgi:hypothetical protein
MMTTTPNLFVHYWSADDSLVTFQEILSLEIDPSILAAIQADLLQQLSGDRLQENLPNFDWANPRMQEKWQSMAQSLLMQVQLPEHIWMSWIQALGGQIEAPSPEPEIPSFADLLNAEVYYERPSDSLEDLPEEPEFTPEIEIAPSDLAEVAWEAEIQEEEELIPSPVSDYFEVSNELPDISELSPTEEEKPQSIKDMLADSTEEKVLDTIQVEDHTLKNLVANQMTSLLAESISLFQRLNFIQELFDGNAEEFSRFIEFIDFEAQPSTWQKEVETRYSFEENAAKQELYQLIERKFS